MARLIYFSLLFLLSSCTPYFKVSDDSPTLSSINLVDRDGLTEIVRTPDRLQQYEQVDYLKPQPYQKVLRIFSRDSQGNIGSIVTVYHPNGQPKQYLEAVNSQASGVYREWYPNGNLKVDAKVIGGVGDISPSAEKSWLFEGIATAYNENGVLEAEILYSKGLLNGPSTYYHTNGKIWKTIPFVNGLADGEGLIYLEDGTLLQKVSFKAGEKSGKSLRYWGDDNIAADEDYNQGRLIEAVYYDLDGNTVAEVTRGNGVRAIFGKDSISELQEIKNGIIDGDVKVFSRGGQLIRLYRMKNNIKHGEEIHYYPNRDGTAALLPKMSIMWFQGKIQGHTKTWYENGVMESQREMGENQKNGLSTAWYKDGQLMLIEDYEKGKLQRGDYYRKGEKYPVSQVVDGQGIATFFDESGNFIRKFNYKNGKPEK